MNRQNFELITTVDTSRYKPPAGPKPWAPDKLHGTLDEAAKLYLQNPDRFEMTSQTIAPLRDKLLAHRVYDMLTSMKALRVFMEYHCYAVWDFMCLLKCLQNKLTCTQIPWKNVENTDAARMINEIVVAEETDIRQVWGGDGQRAHRC